MIEIYIGIFLDFLNRFVGYYCLLNSFLIVYKFFKVIDSIFYVFYFL